MNIALQQTDPELNVILQKLDEDGLRTLSLATAKQALTVTMVDGELVAKVIADPRFGNNEQRKQLEELADTIEDPYLTALGNDQDMQNHPALLSLFRQARAVMSLWYALSDNPRVDAANAVYEAIHAGLDIAAIKEIAHSIRT